MALSGRLEGFKVRHEIWSVRQVILALKSMCRAAGMAALLASAAGPRYLQAPNPGYVNEFQLTCLTPRPTASGSLRANLERVTGVQMAIVLVDSLDGDPIEDVANTLYIVGEVSTERQGRSVLLFVLPRVKDHKDRGEVEAMTLTGDYPDGYMAECCAGSGRFCGKGISPAGFWRRRINWDNGSRRRRTWRCRLRGRCEPDALRSADHRSRSR